METDERETKSTVGDLTLEQRLVAGGLTEICDNCDSLAVELHEEDSPTGYRCALCLDCALELRRIYQ